MTWLALVLAAQSDERGVDGDALRFIRIV